MKKLMFLTLITLLFLNCISERRDKTKDGDISSFYDKVCIEGHVYYSREIGYSDNIFIKLDDDGKPIKCGEK